MSGKTIAVPSKIYERVQAIATAEGTTVEELAPKALEGDLAVRWLEHAGREEQVRRGT
jgi:hypothetical protein